MWASSSCPRTWTRRLWTLACSPTPALASMMLIQSSTSSMVTWSKALTAVSPSPPRSVTLGLDQLPRSCRPSWLGTPSRWRWDPQDKTLPGLQGLPAPLQSFVPTERSSGEWKERLGLSAQAEKALVPTGKTRHVTQRAGLGTRLHAVRTDVPASPAQVCCLHCAPQATCFPLLHLCRRHCEVKLRPHPEAAHRSFLYQLSLKPGGFPAQVWSQRLLWG